MPAASSSRYRNLLALGGLGVALLLTGCVMTETLSNASPKDALQSTVDAARYGRTGVAHLFMMGPALDAFGTTEGLADLRGKLGKVVAMEPPELVSSVEGDQGHGHHGDVQRLFTSSVSGRTRDGAPTKYTFQITCSVSYERFYQSAEAGMCMADEFTRKGYRCDSDTPASNWKGEIELCRVSKIVPAAG
jgi:hypothetical protein